MRPPKKRRVPAEVGARGLDVRQQRGAGCRTGAAGPRPSRRCAGSSSSVRLALVTSVACTRPSVSCHSSQLSTVPTASSPASARARQSGQFAQPSGDLGGAEVRVQRQARARAHLGLKVPGLAQGLAEIGGGAAVLPDDGAGQRAAAGAFPQHHGLALVGDADGGHVGTGRCPPAPRARWPAAWPRVRRRRAPPSRAAGSAASNGRCATRQQGGRHGVEQQRTASWWCPGPAPATKGLAVIAGSSQWGHDTGHC